MQFVVCQSSSGVMPAALPSQAEARGDRQYRAAFAARSVRAFVHNMPLDNSAQ
jgi:hypothetical protein